jgi:hypothetical protein
MPSGTANAGGGGAAAWSRHEYDLGGGDGAEKGPIMSCSSGLASCRGRFYTTCTRRRSAV